MNEVYGIAPNAYQTAKDLRFLMMSFGPCTGRYILAYPENSIWQNLCLEEFKNCRDIEKEKIKTIFRSAHENSAIVEKKNLPWDVKLPWLDNAILNNSKNKIFEKIHVSNDDFLILLKNNRINASSFVANAEYFESNVGCQIEFDTKPENYWEISKILCSISQQIHVIDPYFKPLHKDCKKIFELLISNLSSIKIRRELIFWIRRDTLSNTQGLINISALENEIKSILKNLNAAIKITFNFVEDKSSIFKIHDRYLLTNKGGIIFGQGLQILPSNRKNTAYAMGKKFHLDLYKRFSESPSDFKIEKLVINSI